MLRHLVFIGLLCAQGVSEAVSIYGHRGARGLWPENTLYGYAQALKLKVDSVDFDVHLTRDGVVVVTHDDFLNPDITRDARGRWIKHPIPIKHLRYATLQRYNVCRIKPGTAYAALFPHQRGPKVCRIPSLYNAIRFVQRRATYPVHYQVELKTNPLTPRVSSDPTELAMAVVKVVRQTGIAPLTEIQAFDFRCLNAVQQLAPELATAYLTDHTSRDMMLNSNVMRATQWTGGPLLKEYQGSFPVMVKALGGRLWEPEQGSFSQADVTMAHALGLKVVVWNWPEYTQRVYDREAIAQLVAWGVDGIITDRPDLLMRQLAEQ